MLFAILIPGFSADFVSTLFLPGMFLSTGYFEKGFPSQVRSCSVRHSPA
jgi:hypothetical protein